VISKRPFNQIYLVMDAGCPVAAFTGRAELQSYLKRRLDTFSNPLVYAFGGDQSCAPVVITLSSALADRRVNKPDAECDESRP
jgi:hypothetical protein